MGKLFIDIRDISLTLRQFLGDGFKLFYFVFTQSPAQFIACGSIQLFIDTLIVIEFILFSTYVRQRFNINNTEDECKLSNNDILFLLCLTIVSEDVF